MKLIVVADLLTELYYNGVVRSSKKLDRRDFLELARAAKGSIVRARYYEERNLNDSVYSFLSSQVKEMEFPVKQDNRGRSMLDIDFDDINIARLPNADGIIRLTPIPTEGPINYDENFTKADPGSEHIYCNTRFLQDTGEKIFIINAETVRLFATDMPEMVEALIIVNDDDVDVPDDIVWDIINYVLGVTLKLHGFPVDQTDDGNPNVKLIQSKIASAQAA